MDTFNSRSSAIAAAVIAVLLVIAAIAFGDRPQPASASAEGQLPRTITVVGDGSVTVTPDQAVLSMGTQASADSATDALRSVNVTTAELVAALKAGGVAAQDIATSSLSVYPERHRRTDVTTYSASTQVTAVVRDLTELGPLIDAAARAAGNNLEIHGLEVRVADREEALGEAREAALANAEKRVTEYAAGIGASVGAVTQISELGAPNPISDSGAYLNADMMESAGSFALEPGSQELTAQVSVVYALD